MLRRSPRLRAKRCVTEGQETSIKTPVREVVRKAVGAKSAEILECFMDEASDYSHVTCSSTKASSSNKLTNYILATRSTMIDNECIGPHDAMRLVAREDGSISLWFTSTYLRRALSKCQTPKVK